MSTLITSRAFRAVAEGRVSGFKIIAFALTVLLCLLIVYPVIGMIVRTVFFDGELDFSAFGRAFSNSGLPEALRNTALIMAVSGTAAVIIASLFAWLNERTDARLGWIAMLLPIVPLMLPTIALSIGWVFLGNERAGFINGFLRGVMGWFGVETDAGPLNLTSWGGMFFIYTLYLVPFVYLVVAAAFRNVDPALEEASRVAGASAWRTVWKISLPSIRSAIAGAALLVVVMALAVYSIGATLGTQARIRVLSVHIVSLVQSWPSQLDQAVVIGLVVLVFVGTIWALQRRIAGRQQHATIGGRAMRGNEVKLGAFRGPARALMLIYIAATSVLPVIALALVSLAPFWSPNVDPSKWSLDNYARLFAPGSAAVKALTNSFSLGVVGATIAMSIAAILVVYSRYQGGAVSRFIDGVTKAPGAISHVVVGVAFIAAFAGQPFNLFGSYTILLLVYIVIYMPQASISAGSAGDQLGRELFEASSVSGAGPWRTFRRVALPLMIPGLTAGWVFLFVAIAGELTASSMLAGVTNPVIGFVILNIWESGTFSQLAAMGTVVAVVSAVIVTTVLALSRRASGAVSSGG